MGMLAMHSDRIDCKDLRCEPFHKFGPYVFDSAWASVWYGSIELWARGGLSLFFFASMIIQLLYGVLTTVQ